MELDGKKSGYKSELPVVIHHSIKAKIYEFYKGKKNNHFLLAFGLYVFLYDTARYQDNIRVWATDTFIRKGTGIGQKLLPTIKRDLEKMGWREIHHCKQNNGTFGKRYIEVKFVWKPEAVEKLYYQEPDEITQYKIARSLLINNFGYYEEIESLISYEFDVEINGMDSVLSAEVFHFNEDEMLIAQAAFNGGDESFEYTVPTDRAREIIMELASGYKFPFEAVMNALNNYGEE